jgi:hypothetical protein
MVCGKRYQLLRGSVVYDCTSIACNGPHAVDIPGLGNDWKTNKFIKDNSDADVVTFVKQDRPTTDPENNMGADMPAMSGNNALTDKDLAAAIT